MESTDIKTVGRGPAVPGLEWTIEGWKCISSMFSESFSSVDKSYDPVQDMLTKEHEVFLKMAEDSNNSSEIRIESIKSACASSEKADTVAANRSAENRAIIRTFATIVIAAVGGSQYLKYIGR